MKNKPKSGGAAVWVLSGGAALFLALAAGPGIMDSPHPEEKDSCIGNLQQIDAAKDEWALENIGVPGDPVMRDEVDRFMANGLARCPDGGAYEYNAVCSAPTCSLAGSGHKFP